MKSKLRILVKTVAEFSLCAAFVGGWVYLFPSAPIAIENSADATITERMFAPAVQLLADVFSGPVALPTERAPGGLIALGFGITALFVLSAKPWQLMRRKGVKP